MNNLIKGADVTLKLKLNNKYVDTKGQIGLKAIFKDMDTVIDNTIFKRRWRMECTGYVFKDDQNLKDLMKALMAGKTVFAKVDGYFEEMYAFKVSSLEIDASFDEMLTYKIIIE